jgi:hypothetical protein
MAQYGILIKVRFSYTSGKGEEGLNSIEKGIENVRFN